MKGWAWSISSKSEFFPKFLVLVSLHCLLLLLLLSHFSHVRLCVTPQTAAHQAPPSLGFSRQGRWSGLPFPSPMHESEKWKWKWIRSVVSDSSRPHGLQPTRLLCPWDFPGESTGVRCHCLLLLTQLQTLLGFHPFSHQWLYSVSGSSQDYRTIFKFLKILTSLQILT